MKNTKTILIGTGLVLAGTCLANANNLMQSVEEINKAEVLEINAVENVEAKLNTLELCCGYGMQNNAPRFIAPKDVRIAKKVKRTENRLAKKENKQNKRSERVLAKAK
mgnify:CR=1 FL=1